jgi:predicted nucleotidyltransferase
MTSLFGDVVAHLERRGVGYAVIGATALSLVGMVRATVDVDLLTVDRSVLVDEFWTGLDATIDVRRGDFEDPLAGVVKIARRGAQPVDVVVGKYKFNLAVIERASREVVNDVAAHVASVADVILLKLFAGGPRDAWDVAETLKFAPAAAAEVDARIADLPDDARALWQRIRA